jgi:hypothetical protein
VGDVTEISQFPPPSTCLPPSTSFPISVLREVIKETVALPAREKTPSSQQPLSSISFQKQYIKETVELDPAR